MSSPERGMELPIGEEDIGQVDPVSSDQKNIHIQRGQGPAIVLVQHREQGPIYRQR